MCSTDGCSAPVHHACCTAWYDTQRLPDPESKRSYCWSCIKYMHPQRCSCSSSDADDRGRNRGRNENDLVGEGGSAGGSINTAGSMCSGGTGAVLSSSRHTGEEFERGLRPNQETAVPLFGSASSTEAGSNGPRRMEGSNPPAVSKFQQELNELMKKPWLGQVDKNDKVGLLIVSHYEHRSVQGELKVINGEEIMQPKIKFRIKYAPLDTNEKEMTRKSYNQTRMGEA